MYYNIFLLLLASIIPGTVLAELPLFRYHPSLKKIPYISLGTFATPVQACPLLSEMGSCTCVCKRDDLSGKLLADGRRLFGGNKVRKLEFILADALRHKATDIITVGCAGSNHALATSVYAQLLGLKTHCLLAQQPNSPVVQRNLLLHAFYKTVLHFFKTVDERNQALASYTDCLTNQTGRKPYVIPVGGSQPRGILGFINAAYELSEQLKSGHMPDIIYVPSGSHGTAVGLLIGLQLLGASTQVMAVAVEPGTIRSSLKELFMQTKEFLVQYDATFRTLTWNDAQIQVRTNFSGEEYGCSTDASSNAAKLFKKHEGLILDQTYTAKAAAALLHDMKKGTLKDKRVLFWVTFDAHSYDTICQSV